MFKIERPIVCIQGMGFVGSAMAVAVACAKDEDDNPIYNVVGIDLPDQTGIEKIEMINNGKFPFESVDTELKNGLSNSVANGNLIASTDSDWFGKANIILSDINLDINYEGDGEPFLDLTNYQMAIRTIGKVMHPDTLLVVETTVPPGTCEHIIKPILEEEFFKRSINADRIKIAHSYERVMPGANYLNSIVNYWRVYSGINEEAAVLCEQFLNKIINIKDYPLTRLHNTIASETAKVLENSYRAMNIAFMEEWGRFAESAGFDLFEVVEAIRKRPTHANIRQPGFGVGGYCLTKDPYFAMLGAKNILNITDLEFSFSRYAVKVNNKMPLVSLNKIETLLGGNLQGKKILVMGVSYRQDVGDTRFSPTEIFSKEAMQRGAVLEYHDPLVNYWKEMDIIVQQNLPDCHSFDVVFFAVPHKEYQSIDFTQWALNVPLIFDANKVLNDQQLVEIKNAKIKFASIGRGGISK